MSISEELHFILEVEQVAHRALDQLAEAAARSDVPEEQLIRAINSWVRARVAR